MHSPISGFSRLIITGRDRANYLHNFCTNKIKEMPFGHACEAFFCDVKARLIAHGYILAFEDCHEIWMLAGDEAGLVKHLSRYIITEDVSISSATATTSAIAAIGTASAAMILREAIDSEGELSQTLRCARLRFRSMESSVSTAAAFSVTWAGTPMLWVATSKDFGNILTISKPDAAVPTFEQLRIRERFPIINQDLSIENMAPEAARNSSAISYVKGCYLGQEPIARLDAMGHVNRALQCVRSVLSADQLRQANILAADGTLVGKVTSATAADDGSIGLAMIRSNAIQGPLHCLIEGRCTEVCIA